MSLDLDAETISTTELAAMNISNRFTRTCDALEKIAANGERIANALELISGALICVTEVVEPDEPGGVTRCTIRTHNMSPGLLSMWSGNGVSDGEND